MSTVMPTSHLLGIDSWGYAEESDRRFKRVLVRTLIPVLLFLLAVPFIKFAVEEKEKPLPPPVVELLMQPLPPPPEPPKQEEKKQDEPDKPSAQAKKEEPKPAPKNEPKAQQAAPKLPDPKPAPPAKTARQLAEEAGMSDLRNQLAAMQNSPVLSATTNQELRSAAKFGGSTSNSDRVAASAANSSGGIGGYGGDSVTRTQSGTGLGSRRTAGVESGIGFGSGSNGKGTGNGGNGAGGLGGNRSNEEIQLIVDRNKPSLFSIYNRAVRENPGMESGKVVVSITIAPDGSVTACELVSSTFDNPDLEQKLIARIKLFNFGAKAVPAQTVKYPFNFVSSG